MAISRQRHEWMIAATIQATQANTMRGKKQRAFTAMDFLPRALRPPVPKIKPSEWFKRSFGNG
jgi:hypothetical protein